MLTTSKDKNIWFFNLLLLGVILFKNADVYQDYVFGKSLIIRGIGILGLMLFWYSYFKLPKISLGQLCRNPLLVMFIFIGFVTILRFDSNSDFTLYRKMMMGSYIWPYLMPLLLLVKMETKYIKFCLYWILAQMFLDLFFLAFNFQTIVYSSTIVLKLGRFDAFIINRFSVAANLIVAIAAFGLALSKFKNKWQVLIIGTIILSLVSSMMGGRRSSSLLMILCLFIILCSYLKSKRKIILLVLLALLISFSNWNVVDSLADQFNVMSERLAVNTRDGTETEFYNDMEWYDWIFGKGMDGTYKSLSVSLDDKLNRNLIETGYLNLILHGGLLLLLPYLFFLIKALYLGVSKSKNIFIKSFAFYIGLHLVYLYPGGTPALDLRYTLLFLLINFCITHYRISSSEDFDISKKILKN